MDIPYSRRLLSNNDLRYSQRSFHNKTELMKAILKPNPETQHEIELDALPRPGEAFVFDGMMYRAIDIIWNKQDVIDIEHTDNPEKKKLVEKSFYKPTILLYSQPYIKEKEINKD